MAAAEAREVPVLVVPAEIVNIIANAMTAGTRVMQLYFDSAFNGAGKLVFSDFSLTERSVSCIKLAITAYHATHTPGSIYVGGCSIHLSAIAFHLDRNYGPWVRIRILGRAALVMAGMFSFNHGMIIPKDHAWHSTVVHTANICVLFLEAGLFVRRQIKKDVGTKKLLCDLLIIFVDTFTTSYRFVDSLGKTHSPWDAEKFLNLFGSGLSVLLGVGQISCITFKVCINTRRVSATEEQQATRTAMGGNGDRHAGGQVEDEGVEVGNSMPTVGASQVGSTAHTAKSKVVEWLKKARGVSAGEEEQAARAAMWGNGALDAGGHVKDEGVEVGNNLPVTIGASQVGSTTYTASILSKMVKWFKTRGVSTVEEEQARAAVAAMEDNGGVDAGQQVTDEGVHVVMTSPV